MKTGNMVGFQLKRRFSSSDQRFDGAVYRLFISTSANGAGQPLGEFCLMKGPLFRGGYRRVAAMSKGDYGANNARGRDC